MRPLRILTLLFTAAGVALLGYCAFVLTEAWIFQQRAGRELDRMVHTARGSAARSAPASVSSAAQPRSAPAASGLVGRITIPRVGVSAVVAEGADDDTLARAVGHITGTALPGQPGNVGLAGHRDTFFRPLRNIHLGDTIMLTTAEGNFRYRVVSTKIVDPRAVGVLASTAEEALTLVTCYPFYFVGSAPSRFIVRAERSAQQP
jgi:sortase A